MTNESKIDWTLVVLVTIIGIGLYLIPSPLQSSKTTHSIFHDTTYVMYGNPDTTQYPQPIHHGSSTSVVTASTSNDTSITYYPHYFEKEFKDSSKAGTLQLRTTVYPFSENDTLKAEIQTEYNWQPRPTELIVKTDTVFVMKVVSIPKERPFYEKPSFTIPATASATLGLIYLISRIFK